MEFDSNAHSVFLLNYHLILVVKYRRKVFDDTISERAKEIFSRIAPNYNISLQEWGHDEDHVHILFRAHPKTAISKFINAYIKCQQQITKKRVSFNQRKIMERAVLESKFLSSDNRRSTAWNSEGIHSDSGTEIKLLSYAAYSLLFQNLSNRQTERAFCKDFRLCTFHLQ